jgi:hypothetical protein
MVDQAILSVSLIVQSQRQLIADIGGLKTTCSLKQETPAVLTTSTYGVFFKDS